MRFEGLKDGTNVLIREPTMDDLEASLRFFQALPPEDRRYLRVDVTRSEVVEHRLRQAATGEVHRVVALVDDRIVGDGALEFSGEQWKRHRGEIRVIVDRDYRKKRLGALLIHDLFKAAVRHEVEKVVVKMAAPQTEARKVCERLGFHVDAVLDDYVKDSRGKLHPLIVMSCSLGEMYHELKDFYRVDDWPDG